MIMMRCTPRRTEVIPVLLLLRFLMAAAAVALAVALGDVESGTNNNADVDNISGNIVTEGTSTEATTTTTTSLSSSLEPNLPFSDINILVVSDVHSFVGGHPHEPDRNADYGDLYSFHERLKAHCEANQKGDLWLFNNGDWLHGTGLAMDGNSTSMLPIINAMPWDALTMGRQEATYSDVLRDMNDSVLPTFPGKYITSNVVWNRTKEAYGERYQLLKGNNSTILVFGFLYDMVRPSETIEVVPIEETIQQDWFRNILRQEEKDNDEEKYDAIVVMAQMDNDSPLIDDIYQEIRSNVDPKMPIQFITGHSHKREKTYNIKKDHYVHKIEPGGLFDTIGWVSIPKFDTAKTLSVNTELKDEFRQEFLNTSKTVLHSRLGLKDDQELRTIQGEAVSKLIHDTQENLGLNQIVACPGHDYFRNISIHADNSLWKLWREHVIRAEVFKKEEDRVMFVSKKTFRYDLRGSGKHDAMTLDDVVAIAPYMERVVYVGDVPDWMIRRMNNTFNTYSHHNIIPDYVLAGDLDEIKTVDTYQLYTHEVDVPKIKAKLEKFNFHDFVLKNTGQRDTLYWLDYVRTAFPCKEIEKEDCKKEDCKKDEFKTPYFYDPNELEEEATDGKLTSEDIEADDDEESATEGDNDEEEVWTLPPGGEYLGYVPGKGETHQISQSVYEDYKTQEEREKEEEAEKAALVKRKSSKDLKSQLKERKKTQKSIIKGFALTCAGLILLVPVVCLIMQVTGQNDDNDVGFGEGGIAGIYDQEEMKLLKRQRRRGIKSSSGRRSLHDRPLKEIEII